MLPRRAAWRLWALGVLLAIFVPVACTVYADDRRPAEDRCIRQIGDMGQET